MQTSTFQIVRNLFEEVYGSLPLPVFLFDAQTRIVKANKAFCALTCIAPDQVTGYSIADFFKFLHTYRFPVPPRYHTTLYTAHGEEIPVELNYTKFFGDDDTAKGCIVFLADMRDVTSLRESLAQATIEIDALKLQLAGTAPNSTLEERVRLEQQLKTEKAFLENVIESCGDGIFILDGRGTIIRVNEAFAKIVGKEKSAIKGKLYELGPSQGTFTATTGQTIVLDRSYQEYTYRQMEKFLQCADGEKIENWEFYVFNRAGQIVPVAMTATMQKNSEGVITGSVCVMRDITERKKAEQALEDAYRFRSQFFTNITHEFRTPLTLIIGPLEEVLRKSHNTLSEGHQEQVQVALRNARRLLGLINQLLDFSMLEAGVHEIALEKCDINAFIASLLDAFSPVTQNKRITLCFTPCPELCDVYIDPGKLEKALFNLIGNACKFTPDGGSISVRVTLTSQNHAIDSASFADAAVQQRCLQVSVADTGIGIPEEHLGNIFERFYRAGHSEHQTHSGTGIGLAYTKELVEAMGGHIAVASTVGKGSTFTITIPLKEAEQAITPVAKRALQDQQMHHSELPLAEQPDQDTVPDSITGTKPLICIVDDNPDVLRYISSILCDTFDYITASNGKQALEKWSTHRPDIIVCDVMMPEMDGHALLKTVRATPELYHIPFIFLTARADEETKVQGFDEDVDDYLIKPFSARELRARIQSLLRIRTLIKKTEAQEKKISLLTKKLQDKYSFGNIIGNSPAMRNVYQLIDAVKDSDATVLISGETGTGKELVAHAIHYTGQRQAAPLVSVNCGALPKDLLARELFGHVRGAYTGAVSSRHGYFKEADRGTLFLDEIAEMDKDMQVQLLRVLERGEIIRVGDTVPIKINVRLIAATNKNLAEEVQQGRFREDLYYRLHVIPIHLPPLRERREDIPLLVTHFLKKFRAKYKKEVPQLSSRDLELLMTYPFPGNVRELEHLIERYCLLGTSIQSMLESHSGCRTPRTAPPFPCSSAHAQTLKAKSRHAKEQAEKELILHALKTCDNNVTQAAKMLNISRVYLHKKVKKYGITYKKYK
ncbi:MAG: sigma 54-interacting transcriptional regulator [Desulfobacterota bacterium]|nr:sigma 54-interacting transcriptional regulator [Thermodesulfobacteriota bacterium]